MKSLFPIICLLLGLAGPAVGQRGVGPVRTLAELQDSLRAGMARQHLPGLMLVLVSGDSVLFAGGMGLADLSTRRPVTAATRFRLASVTKTFVAAGLMQLVEQGRLKLTDEVRRLAPEVPIANPWEATDPVRVVHLLEHTAGFDEWGLNHAYNLTATDPRGQAGLDLYRRELRCRWRPGERMCYANPGYQVAGYLLEKLSGQTYEAYVRAHLLGPLGMTGARPELRPAPDSTTARGYVYRDGRYEPVPRLPVYCGPAASMEASAADLGQWLRFFLRDGRAPDGTALLRPASITALETVHSTLAARAGLPVGYGLANCAMGVQGRALFQGHGGHLDGFSTFFGYNRALKLGYALSFNGDARPFRLDQLVQQFLLRRQPAAAPLPAVPLDSAAVAPFLGRYRVATARYEQAGFADYLVGGTHLRRQGNLLLCEPLFGKADTLLPTGPLTFRRPADRVATAVLARDRDGRRVLITSPSYAPAATAYAPAVGAGWWLPPALLGLGVLLALTSALAALVAVGRGVARRRPLPRAQVLPRLLPLAATGALVATFMALNSLGEHKWWAGQLTWPAVVMSLGPLALVACTVAGLLLTVRHYRQFRRPAVAWHLLLTYLALGWLAAVMASYGWLGLRLWTV